MSPSYTHVWHWRNGAPRHRSALDRKGERCRVLARGSNGNLLVEFEDGCRTVAPRHALRNIARSAGRCADGNCVGAGSGKDHRDG